MCFRTPTSGRETGEVDGHELSNFNWGAYDLVVIDESHNFRNNKLATQRPGELEKRTRYQRLMEDIISSGVRTKVLLLSATPVNNQLADLRNQISFIAGGDVVRDSLADSAFSENLDIHSVKETTRLAQTHFTRWSDPKRPPGQRKTRDLIASIGGDFFKLLDGLSIARSRRQIASYYSKEMASLGGFPKRPPPKALTLPSTSRTAFSPSRNSTTKSAPPSRPLSPHQFSAGRSARRDQGRLRAQDPRRLHAGRSRENPHLDDEGEFSQTPRKLRGFVPPDARTHHHENRHARKAHHRLRATPRR
jgi:hypothetical protein